jgi:hypothetical protein
MSLNALVGCADSPSDAKMMPGGRTRIGDIETDNFWVPKENTIRQLLQTRRALMAHYARSRNDLIIPIRSRRRGQFYLGTCKSHNDTEGKPCDSAIDVVTFVIQEPTLPSCRRQLPLKYIRRLGSLLSWASGCPCTHWTRASAMK